MFDFEKALKELPGKPGVYLMKDKKDQVIYVGKAKLLKNRVRQYFRKSTAHSPKIKKMVSVVTSFEYIITDSELEALILELNLIKEHRPKYNTMLKDDKTYPYIKVTVNEAFPRILFTRQMTKDKAKYFGPYTSAGAAKETIDLVRKTWKIRTCHRRLPRDIGKERACLNYHIHECDAPCQGYISSEEYKEKIDKALSFLNGKYESVLKDLEKAMYAASEDLDFEKAAGLRDSIQAVKTIMERQKIVKAANEDQDVIAFAADDQDALVQVFFIRNGKLIGREHFRMEHIEGDQGDEILSTFIKQFYSGTPFIPRELVLQNNIQEAAVIQAWLSDKRGQKVHIKVPQKGQKNKLVALAEKNAAITLKQFGQEIKQKEERTKGAVLALQERLGLTETLHRIEAYDISNTSGVNSVGGMVVFEDGRPKRSDYRKFKIRWTHGPDDYASMEEVLTRRFQHALEEQEDLLKKGLDFSKGKFTKLPDLIVMDGGKGQVNVALKVLNEVGLEIPVCGSVKDDHHRTRGLIYNNQELVLKKASNAFKFLTRIQDEVHRFAIDYHRKIRGQGQVHSILDEIKGVGSKRRKALMMHFGGLSKIKEASLEDLSQVEGIDQRTAKNIFAFFHPKSL